jgi:hypothetical protein
MRPPQDFLDIVEGNAHNRSMTDHPAIPAEFDTWIDAAASHLYNAVDTALDELQRDRDFVDPDAPDFPSPPDGDARDACICAAVNRFKEFLDSPLEGS